MSVEDMFSQMLADLATRELLHYRANWESVAGQLTNIFDSDIYKQLVQQSLFSNSNNIAIGFYTNRYTNKYLLQLAILLGLKKPTHLDSFLISIINELQADMAHIGSHTSLFGCHFCETKGKCPANRQHDMYFDNISALLRSLEDFKVGNSSKNIYQLSLYTQLSTFSGSSFFVLDELYLIARGIEKLVADLVAIRNCITSSEKYVPISSLDSFVNVFVKIDSTCTVDWLDFLLYLVSTLVTLTPELLEKMESAKLPGSYTLYHQAARPSAMLLHSLNEESNWRLLKIDKLWGPFHQFVNLNNDLMEGVGGPSVKEALLKYYWRTTGLTGHNFCDSVVIVAARLWMNSTIYSSYMYQRKRNEISRGNYYVMFTCLYRNNLNVMKEHDAAGRDLSVPIVKQCSQSIYIPGHQTQPTYAVISVNDICHQVCLVQYLPN
ncbi:hypothetical protein PHYBLDRAFT_143923 [Phycomyces blakesleeanus NRRL 1555(-)]|uniref:Uncharacterized protein n=1 Tax=Phycomyces blakesleeanus (strain ATCC 8743b / DSM 1359 / FGSC 10004 / NBRC 33097 / NRRL 1555) TaxID=763407 RepID=A0A162XM51_PHYB8|nr:hypothetical protein PHYBLDRAFT_143923 [Phycomyces blakesleeanus NRRL 1555(-)]OAD75675.1 hypothetical protein PHYBLDRAFT_143923 [Phycomyces blakesleeanus NRRL 1555(-)]|eukprot:XP_018293715.1 hypothetical protein PHYBLDRAFT_143923 [Phycomyces blakesleeanus NRRL 1555(-)]